MECRQQCHPFKFPTILKWLNPTRGGYLWLFDWIYKFLIGKMWNYRFPVQLDLSFLPIWPPLSRQFVAQPPATLSPSKWIRRGTDLIDDMPPRGSDGLAIYVTISQERVFPSFLTIWRLSSEEECPFRWWFLGYCRITKFELLQQR